MILILNLFISIMISENNYKKFLNYQYLFLIRATQSNENI